MIYVEGGRLGFYSNILWYLNNCHVAEKLDDEIVFENFPLGYCDDPKTGFYNYFEKYQLNKDLKYDEDLKNLKDIENIRNFKNTSICGFILDNDIRRYINFLIKKYLIIREDIKNKIILNSTIFNNKKVLGVHVRQTDLYTSKKDRKLDKPLKINNYIDKIESNIDNYDMIYVMSDNNKSINDIKEYFKGFPIYYLTDIIRSSNEIDPPVFRTNNNYKYKLGEDIIIETELLSLCDKILITNSNISSFCLANNLDIEFDYLDLKINNQFFNEYKKILKYGL